jgi:MFS transporter, OFA family, oxalate/formate antiporter
MNPDKKRWLILLAGILANLCMGAAYASSVFAKPMLIHLALLVPKMIPNPDGVGKMVDPTGAMVPDMTKWAIAFSINLAFLPIGMLLSGRIADKKSTRLVVVLGGLMFGLGMFLAGFANSLTMLYVTFGITMGLGSGAAYGAIVSTAVRWFPDFRGLASGLAVGALGFGSFVIAPVANSMINPAEPDSVLYAFKVLGLAFLAIIAVASVIMVNPPAGYKPAGFNPKAPASKAASKEDLVWTQMLGRAKFWGLYLMYACGTFSGLMIISQASPIAQSMTNDIKALGDPKLMAAAGAGIASILGLANAAGRIVWGSISDRIGRLLSLALMFVLTSAAMFLLPTFVVERSTFVPLAIVLGACFGGYLGTFPSICADAFGVKNMAVNYGVLFSAFSVAAVAGPFVGAAINKSSGGYGPAFTIAGVVAAVGFVLAVCLMLAERSAAPKPGA